MTNRGREDDRLEPLWREAARRLDEQPRAGADAACLDAETLAAWAEHRLAAAQSALLERHAAACPRCRALLATFAGTTPAPVPAATPWWKAPLIRWAAPAAAVAAAAIVWVSVERAGPGEIQETQKATDALASTQPPRLEGELPVTPSQQAVDAVRPARPPAAAAPAPPAGPEPERQRDALSERTARSPATTAPEPLPPPAVAEMAAGATAAAFAAAALDLTTSDSQVRWRIRGALAERSADGGITWTSTALPTRGPFAAGTCPSADVCWLVGPEGLVLRTADGSSWSAAASPGPAALVAVSATDAQNAEVTAADGRGFVTSDGGRTWSPKPRR